MKKYLLSLSALFCAGAIFATGFISGQKESPSLNFVTYTGDEIVSIESTPVSIKLLDSEKNVMATPDIFKNYVSAVVGITARLESRNYFSQSAVSTGTGFIIKENGYILTNYHVVENGTEIKVSMYDEREYNAILFGYDIIEDIALLKIEENNLPTVVIGDSENILVGEDITVIGNPLGELTHSLSKGVVSALNRVITMSDGTSNNMIQIDASVNSGNSGGPAFDSSGKVVGVVTAKYSSASLEGLGFCIPINDAVRAAEDLLEYGYVRGRPILGITVKNIYNYPVKGVYVETVSGCSEKAGMQSGDIITRFNGVEISSTTALEAEKNKYRAGDEVIVTLVRGTQTLDIVVKLDEKTSM